MKVRLLKSVWLKKAIKTAGDLLDVDDVKGAKMIAKGRAEVVTVLNRIEAAVLTNPLAVALGLTPETIKDLEKRGIKVVEELAVATVGDLKGLTGVPAKQLKALITRAVAIVSPLEDDPAQ